MYIDNSSKMQFAFFDVTLCELIAEEWRQYQFFGKVATHFPYFHLLTHPL